MTPRPRTSSIKAVDGAKLDVYAKATAEDGLMPESKRVFDEVAPRRRCSAPTRWAARRSRPARRSTLLVSAGFPKLAYDDDKDILLRNGATGKKLDPIAESSRDEKDPTFSDDGDPASPTSPTGRCSWPTATKPDEAPLSLTGKDDFFKDLSFAPTRRR